MTTTQPPVPSDTDRLAEIRANCEYFISVNDALWLLELVDSLQARLTTAEGLVADMFDSGKCWFDHNGHCQEHGWFETEPACPHGRARALGLGEGDSDA